MTCWSWSLLFNAVLLYYCTTVVWLVVSHFQHIARTKYTAANPACGPQNMGNNEARNRLYCIPRHHQDGYFGVGNTHHTQRTRTYNMYGSLVTIFGSIVCNTGTGRGVRVVVKRSATCGSDRTIRPDGWRSSVESSNQGTLWYGSCYVINFVIWRRVVTRQFVLAVKAYYCLFIFFRSLLLFLF